MLDQLMMAQRSVDCIYLLCQLLPPLIQENKSFSEAKNVVKLSPTSFSSDKAEWSPVEANFLLKFLPISLDHASPPFDTK
ncbi:hypothetical protein ACHAXS_010694 [Conticribra weissflogii]